jgi:predicted NUDIX family NTP pyrophosphohydrolase
MSIPKGVMEEGEFSMHAAKREFKEETGINLDEKELKGPHTIEYGKDKQLIYYVLNIDLYSEIGMNGPVVNKKQLQLEEVDWAGFIKVVEARHKLFFRQLPILEVKENQKYIKPYGSDII